ncbi:MAG: hypothetical protein MN733_29970 [Nitrososphaera sp.]|nr:hypothetical protein [Nitrososphaera sp.]
MKIWLDDERNPAVFKSIFAQLNDGEWVWIKTYEEFENQVRICVLFGPRIEAVSFDNDLGSLSSKEGYDALCLIERLALERKIDLPELFVHTANPSASQKMHLVIHRLNEKFSS